MRGRKTRWGVVNVENEQHCDFNYLRNFLTRYVALRCVALLSTPLFRYLFFRRALERRSEGT